MKKSAGILPFRKKDEIEVFLAHMGGPFWRKKKRSWSIVKGEVREGEDLLKAAKREFFEETSKKIDGEFIYLGSAKSSNKILYVWAVESDIDTDIKSNTFEMEWPLGSGEIRSFPEVDRAKWFKLKEAKEVIVSYQEVFLDRLLEKISSF